MNSGMIEAGSKKNHFICPALPSGEEAGIMQSAIHRDLSSLLFEWHERSTEATTYCRATWSLHRAQDPYPTSTRLADSGLIFHESEKIKSHESAIRQEKTYLSSRIILPATISANLSLPFLNQHTDTNGSHDLVLTLPVHGKKIDLTGIYIRPFQYNRSMVE